MYSATESKELRFHFLHKDDLQPIGYDKVRKDTGKHVDDETGKVGVAKVVIRNKQHLAALRSHEGVLVLETVYYADEVRKPGKVDGSAGVQKGEVDMAKSLVENLSSAQEEGAQGKLRFLRLSLIPSCRPVSSDGRPGKARAS